MTDYLYQFILICMFCCSVNLSNSVASATPAKAAATSAKKPAAADADDIEFGFDDDEEVNEDGETAAEKVIILIYLDFFYYLCWISHIFIYVFIFNV